MCKRMRRNGEEERGGGAPERRCHVPGQSSAACPPNPNCHQSTRAHVQLRKTYCHRVPIRHQVTKPHRKGTGIQCCTNSRAKRSWLLDRHDITVVSARAYPLDGKHVRDPVWKLQTRMLVNLPRCEFRSPSCACIHTSSSPEPSRYPSPGTSTWNTHGMC